MKSIEPKRPENLNPLASDVLARLRETSEAANLVIGGGVALNCYAPPRLTNDVDAWWVQRTSLSERAATIECIRQIVEATAGEAGLTLFERPRRASEVVSVELRRDRKSIFSFQIAPRDVELEAPLVRRSPFAPVPLEALADNLGAKMTALVARGAPRDFQDIHMVVRTEMASPPELWALFEAKNAGYDLAIAKAQVLQRLSEIELRRPLIGLAANVRDEANILRTWVRSALVERPFGIQPSCGKG